MEGIDISIHDWKVIRAGYIHRGHRYSLVNSPLSVSLLPIISPSYMVEAHAVHFRAARLSASARARVAS